MVTLSVVSILAHIKEWILFYVLTINTILSWLFCICKICKFGFVSPFSSLGDNQCASLILCPCLNACLHPKCSRSKLEYDLKSRLFVILCFSYCLFTSDLQFEHEVLTVMSKVYAPLRCLYQDLNYCIFRTKVALDQEIHNKEEKNT